MPKAKPASDSERMARAEEYLAAAREHYDALTKLPDVPDHLPLAYYLAGLAVECLFRAYSEASGGEHDPGHDLRRHAVQGRFFDRMPPSKREELEDDLNEIWKRWLNNHRYRSLASLRSFLTDAELYRLSGHRTVKGDVVLYNWKILAEATNEILTWGLGQWNTSKTRLSKS